MTYKLCVRRWKPHARHNKNVVRISSASDTVNPNNVKTTKIMASRLPRPKAQQQRMKLCSEP